MRELASRMLLGLFSANEIGFNAVAAILMIIEACLSHLVILKVKYTEIDWSTYMQQVECYSNKGILNYTQIGGDTGPVVYPAGHIFVYRILHFLTSSGKNIRLAQHIFEGFYLFNLFMVFRILLKTVRIPPIVLFLVSVTGYRIHSIFMLRLFNDPLAMMLFYVAMDRFLNEKWLVGCIFYSVAVSIKMNVLLFAPALFFTLILNNTFTHTFGYLALCGVIQLYIGSPFLIHDWKSYVQRSFDLGRVFMFKWTVNWRFLPEELFLDKRFHIALLVGHITVLGLFAWYMWFRRQNGLPASMYIRVFEGIQTSTSPLETYYAFCTANFIGIAFSRSLHYQFYSWYFHQLPFLLFCDYPKVKSISDIPWNQFFWKVPLLFAIELCWNVYPSTWWSSGLLHVCHVIIFWHLISTRVNRPKDLILEYSKDQVSGRQALLEECLEEYSAIIPRPPFPFEINDEDKEENEDKEEEEQENVEDYIDELERDEEQKYANLEDEFEDYLQENMDGFRDEHKVYYTDDGEKQVSGISPIRKRKKLKLHEKVKSLYTQALMAQTELQQEMQNAIGEDEETDMSEEESEELDESDTTEESEKSRESSVAMDTEESEAESKAKSERVGKLRVLKNAYETSEDEEFQQICNTSNGIRNRIPSASVDNDNISDFD